MTRTFKPEQAGKVCPSCPLTCSLSPAARPNISLPLWCCMDTLVFLTSAQDRTEAWGDVKCFFKAVEMRDCLYALEGKKMQKSQEQGGAWNLPQQNRDATVSSGVLAPSSYNKPLFRASLHPQSVLLVKLGFFWMKRVSWASEGGFKELLRKCWKISQCNPVQSTYDVYKIRQ